VSRVCAVPMLTRPTQCSMPAVHTPPHTFPPPLRTPVKRGGGGKRCNHTARFSTQIKCQPQQPSPSQPLPPPSLQREGRRILVRGSIFSRATQKCTCVARSCLGVDRTGATACIHHGHSSCIRSNAGARGASHPFGTGSRKHRQTRTLTLVCSKSVTRGARLSRPPPPFCTLIAGKKGVATRI